MSLENKRNSNIEMLRIIAMFFIVAGHFIDQASIIEYKMTFKDFTVMFFGSGSRIAVNLFVIISAWYLVDTQFKPSKVLSIYWNVFFYCVPITGLIFILGLNEAPLKEAVKGFLPFFGRPLWFASGYIILLLFKPFLDKILEWDQVKLRKLILLLFFFFSIIYSIPGKTNYSGLDITWLSVIYLFIGYIKMYIYDKRLNCRGVFLAGGGNSLFNSCFREVFRGYSFISRSAI